MDNQLLRLFVLNSLTHVCLAASISTAPLTTSTCLPGSSSVNDCMTYTCDENGQWQEFEFTRTDECCLKTHHPACARRDKTSTGGKWDKTSSGQAADVSSTEFVVTTESPLTTTSSPLCVSGSTKEEDCGIFFCQDGQWQVGEFTATQECCLQTFHPKCQAMGFTSTGQATDVSSTGQATDVSSTEFIPTTQSPPKTTSTPTCDSGSMKAEDCIMFICQDGQWQVGELIASKECCTQNFHPMCQAMGFTSTGQATELTSTDQATGFTSTGQATGLTTTEFIPTTQSPPTTSTPTCDSGSMKAEDCRMFFCEDGQWQPGELIASKECCIQNFLPKCEVMGFTTTDQATGSTSTSQATGLTSTEFTSTTIATTTKIHTCEVGSGRIQDCTVYLCENGEWQPFEFLASEECCLKVSHPMCIELGFTGEPTGFTSPVSSSTTGSPNADCSLGSSRVEECGIYICENGQWQRFEFFASEECCLKENHPKCEQMGFSSPVSSSTTGSPNAECAPGSSSVHECGIYICENGQWQLFEFFVSEECCLKENHPKCAALTTPPKDDSSSHEWPLTDCDSDSPEEELDVILIRLPLLPDLPFPVAYRNDRPLNAHKDTSGDEHAVHRQQ